MEQLLDKNRQQQYRQGCIIQDEGQIQDDVVSVENTETGYQSIRNTKL